MKLQVDKSRILERTRPELWRAESPVVVPSHERAKQERQCPWQPRCGRRWRTFTQNERTSWAKCVQQMRERLARVLDAVHNVRRNNEIGSAQMLWNPRCNIKLPLPGIKQIGCNNGRVSTAQRQPQSTCRRSDTSPNLEQ